MKASEVPEINGVEEVGEKSLVVIPNLLKKRLAKLCEDTINN